MTERECYDQLARTRGMKAHSVAEALSSGLTIQQIAARWARPVEPSVVEPFLTPACQRYPPELYRLSDPPLRLFWRGREPCGLKRTRVGIVGSRKATDYGLRVARQLGAALTRRGVDVCSGLAIGIDAAAHRGAVDEHKADLRNLGRPIAVLGHGWQHQYPGRNGYLRTRVEDCGTLLTEYPPSHPPKRWTFPARNRLIAALCEHLVVVEAGPQSGSLHTARSALDAGHTVWIVPNKMGYANSGGVLGLLNDGAYPILDLEQFVDQVAPRRDTSGSAVALEDLTPHQQLLLKVIAQGESRPSALAEVAQCDPRSLSGLMAELELGGLLLRTDQGWELDPTYRLEHLPG